MDRIATAFKVLALLVALSGIACLYLIHRPPDLVTAWRVAGLLAHQALSSSWVAYAAGAALVTAVGARLVEWVPLRPPRRRDVHRLETPIELASTMPELVVVERGSAASGIGLDRHLRGSRPDVPAFVDELLAAAIEAGASDVHIRPLEVETRIALRVRGELAEVVTVPREHHEPIVRRLKILAQLVTYQTDLPQDGRFGLESASGAVDVRSSVLPTHHGEKVVLRLARAGQGLVALDRLGMPEALRERYEQLLAQPQGLIVLTGPTGCGKTTTLYASLDHIHRTRGELTSIATLEDPVEVDLAFLSQTQIDRAAGLSFGESLRAVLRQDPDVLMIGEIRDRETAHIAVEAGLTGHLILATLHADSTAGIFHRLIDMGIEPFLASSSVLAALSQRLARRLCRECRRPEIAGRSEVKRLVESGITKTAAESLSYYSAPGCEACGQTGRGDRTAVFELLRVTPELRQLIARKVSTPEIEKAALEAGMTPLLRAAVLEAVAGDIGIDEALRVAG